MRSPGPYVGHVDVVVDSSGALGPGEQITQGAHHGGPGRSQASQMTHLPAPQRRLATGVLVGDGLQAELDQGIRPGAAAVLPQYRDVPLGRDGGRARLAEPGGRLPRDGRQQRRRPHRRSGAERIHRLCACRLPPALPEQGLRPQRPGSSDTPVHGAGGDDVQVNPRAREVAELDQAACPFEAEACVGAGVLRPFHCERTTSGGGRVGPAASPDQRIDAILIGIEIVWRDAEGPLGPAQGAVPVLLVDWRDRPLGSWRRAVFVVAHIVELPGELRAQVQSRARREVGHPFDGQVGAGDPAAGSTKTP